MKTNYDFEAGTAGLAEMLLTDLYRNKEKKEKEKMLSAMTLIDALENNGLISVDEDGSTHVVKTAGTVLLDGKKYFAEMVEDLYEGDVPESGWNFTPVKD